MSKVTMIDRVKSELARAKAGEDLTITGDMWLAGLNLQSDTPDGLTLFSRFTTGMSLVSKGRLVLSGATNLTDTLMDVLIKIQDGTNTDQELQLARNFSLVATRQIVREGDICPIAHRLAVSAFEIRADFFPDEIHPYLQQLSTLERAKAARKEHGTSGESPEHE